MMVCSHFFDNTDIYTDESLWSAYGPQHFAWIAGMGLVCLVACILFRRASEESQNKALKFVALWILVQEILKDLIFYLIGGLKLGHLPLHICGISIFFTLWYAYKPNKLNGSYIYGVSLPGALAALTFPDWTNLPLWHFSSLNSFTIHGELVLFALLVLTSGRLRPDFNQVPKLFAMMAIMAVPIYFLNKAWDTNFMFINTPSPGSPLVALYDLFGEGYVIAAAVLLFLVFVIMFLPWKIADKRKENRA